MSWKCEYCESLHNDEIESCPNCGAPKKENTTTVTYYADNMPYFEEVQIENRKL